MAHFPSLPEQATLEHLFRRFPKGARPLMELHDALLRQDDSVFSIAERELIAAYVSALNTCEYCFGAHRTMAIAFGIEPDLIDALVSDFDTAPVSERLKATLAYVRKVVHRDSVLPEDIRKMEAAGLNESGMQDALMIASLYSLMNRLVDGAGLARKQTYEQPNQADPGTRQGRTYVQWGLEAGFLHEDAASRQS